jgi:hypothetical protein
MSAGRLDFKAVDGGWRQGLAFDGADLERVMQHGEALAAVTRAAGLRVMATPADSAPFPTWIWTPGAGWRQAKAI